MKKLIFYFILLFSSISWAQQKYVTTIHPFQKILQAVVGSRGEVHAILPPGASPHTYQLRPSNVREIEKAGALFYGSPHLDEWVLKFQNPNRIELLKLVPAQFQLALPFLKQEHTVIDPHFWTDPLTVKALIPELTRELSRIDPAGADIFQKNAQQFERQLDSLHLRLARQLAGVRGKRVMLSHPFFAYFFQRYGIELIDVIEKIPGKEPTPRQTSRLINKARQEKITAIFDHSQIPDLAAKLVAEASGVKIYQLDPLGGLPGRDSYAELLWYNAGIILEALK